ncbi:hypothetical protein MNBD_GAMMA11-397 [hydrothermal vent metagenome]|uniref:COGs COG2929 n=1 Tax=hydrothermal vent metagenome TaxID=652676 RepID=A0A3B0X043_9ZZZZ
MDFEWDENKNKENIKNRNLDFKDVIPVFFDENAVSYEDDRSHYPDGQRITIIGESNNRFLYVAYAEIDEGRIIRIISARKAVKQDIQRYRRGY